MPSETDNFIEDVIKGKLSSDLHVKYRCSVYICLKDKSSDSEYCKLHKALTSVGTLKFSYLDELTDSAINFENALNDLKEKHKKYLKAWGEK